MNKRTDRISYAFQARNPAASERFICGPAYLMVPDYSLPNRSHTPLRPSITAR
ncbi:hypothetical protein HMPREF0240_00127 [Clostridium sp. D5]|nr:hypothetical protein HMPREF0240_00127 [Clostridium sp. D5]